MPTSHSTAGTGNPVGTGTLRPGTLQPGTLQPGTPLELLGSSPGITVIDPSTVLTRLWYFDGKFLRAEGFRLDQEYVRSLVALSNQAVGTGVVHGFDVHLGASDQLAVTGGLALAASGRVVHLPASTRISIAQLVSRAQGRLDPGNAAAAGTADFSRCADDAPVGGDQPVPARPLYVLTVSAADALCGEEERFGRLCEDACASDTDRSVAVEGVSFRLREIVLGLPASRSVPFVGRHLRSRVASAYYAAERTAVGSMISGAGLRTDVWCAGADGIGGEEIPLAVLDRNGTVTTFVDMWTARRELNEPTPQRYWQWRTAMRPLDVFWAQVLQFQCQLVDAAGGSDGQGPATDCGDERRALAEVDDVLGTLTETPPRASLPSALDSAVHAINPDVIARLGELRAMVTGALSGAVRSASGSLLIDRGIVETPSGGYLPVDPGRDVQQQVRAWMGSGVDLRFCVVRPDFVPEALWEAQHMDRISLVAGLDDPGAVEEVDVLVPGGTFERRDTKAGAFEGRVEVLPSVIDAETGSTKGAALSLAAVARNQVRDGWSWSLAAYGEAPSRLGVQDLASAMFGSFATAPRESAASAAENVEVHIEPDEAHAANRADPGFLLRATREASSARMRGSRIDDLRRRGVDASVPDLAVAADQRRPVVAWFDVETGDALDALPLHGRTSLRMRATVYSRGSTTPVLFDARLVGLATVTSRQELPSGPAGGHTILLTTRVTGTADPLVIADGQVSDGDPRPIGDVEARWTVALTGSGARVVSVEIGQARPPAGSTGRKSGGVVGATFVDSGSPRHVTGAVSARAGGADRNGPQEAGDWRGLTDATSSGRSARRLLSFTLDEAAGVLDLGNRGRDLATSIIDVIGAELAAHKREEGFVQEARTRMFEQLDDTTSAVRATTDWVMFHRRRTRVCTDSVRDKALVLQRFRWFHAVRPAADDLRARLSTLDAWTDIAGSDAGVSARVWARLDNLGFQPVTTVEFLEGSIDVHSSVAALRTAWSAGARGERLLAGLVATSGPGEGAALELGRLGSVTGAVGDLVDVSRLETRVLSDIPPEFQTEGMHGVLLTLATERPVDRECAHVFRVSKRLLGQIVPALPQLGSIDEVIQLTTELGAPPPVVATFEDALLTNAGELEADWNGHTAVEGFFVLDRALPGDGEVAETWRTERLDVMKEVLGLGDVSTPDRISLDLSPCRALLLVQEAAD